MDRGWIPSTRIHVKEIIMMQPYTVRFLLSTRSSKLLSSYEFTENSEYIPSPKQQMETWFEDILSYDYDGIFFDTKSSDWNNCTSLSIVKSGRRIEYAINGDYPLFLEKWSLDGSEFLHGCCTMKIVGGCDMEKFEEMALRRWR